MKLVIFLVILGAVVTTAWIFCMPLVLTSTLSKRTGFGVKVNSLVFNPFSAGVTIEGLIVTNPESFARRDYLDVQRFEATAPLKQFFEEHPQLDYVHLDIRQITFVRTREGTVNSTLFYDRLFPKPAPPPEPDPREKTKKSSSPGKESTKQPSPPKAPPAEAPRPKTHDFLIKQLDLKIDKIVTDDRFGPNPVQKEVRLGIDQHFFNVGDPKQLLTRPVVRALAPVATALSGLIPGTLGDVFNSAVDAPANVDPKKKAAAPDPMKSISDTLEESRKP
jgi:hypothetical protein